jgi:plasmid stability protein
MLTIRNLDPEVKERLRRKAAEHGRSMEAEARLILTEAALAEEPSKDVVSAIIRNFADLDVVLELPDRANAHQRQIDL